MIRMHVMVSNKWRPLRPADDVVSWYSNALFVWGAEKSPNREQNTPTWTYYKNSLPLSVKKCLTHVEARVTGVPRHSILATQRDVFFFRLVVVRDRDVSYTSIVLLHIFLSRYLSLQAEAKGTKVKIADHVADVRSFAETALPGRRPVFISHR